MNQNTKAGKGWVSPIRHAFISERSLLGFAWVCGSLLFVALTGLLVWLTPFSVSAQMTMLFHTVLGLLILVPFGLWQLSPWLATRKAPRKARKISAYIGFRLLAASVEAGLVIAWQGVFEIVISHRWAQVHRWTAVLALPFLFYHVLSNKQETASANGASGQVPSYFATPWNLRRKRRDPWT